MTHIEIETSFGTVSASEQALAEAVRDLLLTAADDERAWQDSNLRPTA